MRGTSRAGACRVERLKSQVPTKTDTDNVLKYLPTELGISTAHSGTKYGQSFISFPSWAPSISSPTLDKCYAFDSCAS